MSNCSVCGMPRPPAEQEVDFDLMCEEFAEQIGATVEDIHVLISAAMGDEVHKSVCARLGLPELTGAEKAAARAAGRMTGFMKARH
jgi:hypothetical protein